MSFLSGKKLKRQQSVSGEDIADFLGWGKDKVFVSLKRINQVNLTLEISYLGYNSKSVDLYVSNDTIIDIYLVRKAIIEDEVIIIATRADKNTTATYKNIKNELFKLLDLVGKSGKQKVVIKKYRDISIKFAKMRAKKGMLNREKYVNLNGRLEMPGKVQKLFRNGIEQRDRIDKVLGRIPEKKDEVSKEFAKFKKGLEKYRRKIDKLVKSISFNVDQKVSDKYVSKYKKIK